MKAIFCGRCFDIRGINISGWTTCNCGNMKARWTDPVRGTIVVSAHDRSKARIIGMNNAMLRAALMPQHELMVIFGDGTSFTWDQVHKHLCKEAKGYVFHESARNCWACIVEVGQTSDMKWEESDEATKETKIIKSEEPNEHSGAVPPPAGNGADTTDKEDKNEESKGNS